jgi:hypothetical protein
MRHLIPPWCLHWAHDGELAQGDRQDLLQTLVEHDARLAGPRIGESMELAKRPLRRASRPPNLGSGRYHNS